MGCYNRSKNSTLTINSQISATFYHELLSNYQYGGYRINQSDFKREYECIYVSGQPLPETGCSVSLLSVVCGLYYYLDKEIVIQVFSILSENVIQVFLVVFLLNFILFADRVLLRLLFRSLPPASPAGGHPLPRRGVSTS